MNKEDTINKLEQREARRRRSIVKSMISDPQPAEQEPPQKQQAGAKANALDFITAKETRSKRIGILVRPSVYQEVQKKCKKMGLSVNNVINQFLERFIDES